MELNLMSVREPSKQYYKYTYCKIIMKNLENERKVCLFTIPNGESGTLCPVLLYYFYQSVVFV